MRAKHLLVELQELIAEHEPHVHRVGELEIYVDKFKRSGDEFIYAGIDKKIDFDPDAGMGYIINGFVEPSLIEAPIIGRG